MNLHVESPPPPLTFACYDEGQGVSSLYLQQEDLRWLLPALRCLGACCAFSMGDERWVELECLHLAPFSEWLMLDERRDTAGSENWPGSLMAGPEQILGKQDHILLALSVTDTSHVILWSRETHHLERVLQRGMMYMGGTPEDLPEPTLMRPLMRHVEPGSWWRARAINHRRFRQLEIELSTPEHAQESYRWVSPQRSGRWRAWSW